LEVLMKWPGKIAAAGIVGAVSLGTALPQSSAAEAKAKVELGSEQTIDILYRGTVFGIPVLRAKVSAAFVGKSYAARADFRSSALAALFKKVTVIAGTTGYIEDEQLKTRDYWHKELDGRKNRQLSMTYEPEKVSIRVNPPLSSMGDPAASMEQRLEAMDPVSGILALAVQAGSASAARQCAGTLKVFDGKQRYNLRLEAMGLEKVRTRAFKGMALRCNAWYEPVAGFDPDDLANPKEYERPIVMWLAEQPMAGLRVPVRFEAKLDFGRAVVEARKIDVGTRH
jgi:hypothetical protein